MAPGRSHYRTDDSRQIAPPVARFSGRRDEKRMYRQRIGGAVEPRGIARTRAAVAGVAPGWRGCCWRCAWRPRLAAALVVRAAAERDAVRAFDVDATKIESNVAISLRRVDDVAVALATTLATEQRAMTNSELARWYAGVSAGGRYPGLLGFTYIRYVPAARLSQFAAVHGVSERAARWLLSGGAVGVARASGRRRQQARAGRRGRGYLRDPRWQRVGRDT